MESKKSWGKIFQEIDLEKIFHDIDNFSKKFGKHLKEIHDKMVPFLEEIGKVGLGIAKYLEGKDKLSLIMLDNGWPPMRHILPDDVHRFLEANNKLNENDFLLFLDENINEIIDNKYLDYLFSEWEKNNLILKRNEILKEAIDCHKKGYYSATVIILLSQIEGMIADGFNHIGYMGGSKYKKYFKELLNNQNKIKENQVKNFILEQVLVHFEHGKTVSSNISRHAIMHGAISDYGTSKNSLRVILIFDFLQSIFGYAWIDSSSVYHKVGCHYLMSTKKNINISKDISDPEKIGMKKCSVCFKN